MLDSEGEVVQVCWAHCSFIGLYPIIFITVISKVLTAYNNKLTKTYKDTDQANK